MKTMTYALMCACLAFSAGGAAAQDEMKKSDATHRDPTMQECKGHIAMAKKDGMKRDHAAMKMDKKCADMMKNEGSMKRDTPADPMKR